MLNNIAALLAFALLPFRLSTFDFRLSDVDSRLSDVDSRLSAVSLVGTWKLVAADVIQTDGRTVADYGSAPSGLAMFTTDGQYVVEVYRGPADRTKFASNDRKRGTPEEYRDAQLSTSTHFGRYTVDEAKHTITFAITSSSYPNLDGTTQVRPFTLQGDSLAWRVAARPDGSVPVSKFVRVK